MPTDGGALRCDLDDSRIKTTFLSDGVEHVIDEPARSTYERRVQRKERWLRVKLLGRGTYGAVYLQKRHEAGVETSRAVKEIQKRVAPGKDLDYFREIEAIMKFSHAKYRHCFVTSNGWYDDDDTVYIAMEFIEHGDLRHYLSEALPEPETIQISAQVLEGLTFMHSNRFIHRDLKPSNIMVVATGPKWFVKIADFGISKRRLTDATNNLTAVGGTLGFVAPEAMGMGPKKSYTDSVDMWSLGALAYRMLTETVPFEGMHEIAQYAFGQINFPKDSEAFKSISEDGQDFIANLMQLNPDDRMSAASATKHPWLAAYLEAQSVVTIIDSFAERGDERVEKDGKAPSSTSCPAEETTAVDTDMERTIRPFYGNYKPPFVSDCADEFNTHGGKKLAIDSTFVLEGPFEIPHTSVPSRVFDSRENSLSLTRSFGTLSRQVSFGVETEMHQCVVCASKKFDFKCSTGHVMCTSCYNQELRLSLNNPQNVTYKCCISSSTPSEQNQERSLGAVDESDGRETNQDDEYREQDELDGSKLQQNPVPDQDGLFDGSGACCEEYYDSSPDHDSDDGYESEELPLREETQQPEQTKPNPPQTVACQNCKSTRGPVETLPCEHRICHACLVQFLALSLISPKFMNITCCDYPLHEIGQYCWRRILVDPRLNAAWERLQSVVSRGWTCPRGHPPKHGSPLLTHGPIPLWRQAVKCSGCLPSSSVRRGSDSSHAGNANFCLFCSKEVGSGGCRSCEHNQVVWEFISRLKKCDAFRVPWMAEDVREAYEVKERMDRGERLEYETLEDFQAKAKEQDEPESRSASPPPPPPHTQNEAFPDPDPATAYPDHTRPFPQYRYPPRQNQPYFYPQPYPDFAPPPQNFYHESPPGWAPNYPQPHPAPYYGMQGQRTYPHNPYSAPGYDPRYSASGRIPMISCCYCTGNHIVQPGDKIIQCSCGGRMCGICYEPYGPCQAGCINGRRNAHFYV